MYQAYCLLRSLGFSICVTNFASSNTVCCFGSSPPFSFNLQVYPGMDPIGYIRCIYIRIHGFDPRVYRSLWLYYIRCIYIRIHGFDPRGGTIVGLPLARRNIGFPTHSFGVGFGFILTLTAHLETYTYLYVYKFI